VMVSAREHLAAREYEEAFVLLDKAGTIVRTMLRCSARRMNYRRID